MVDQDEVDRIAGMVRELVEAELGRADADPGVVLSAIAAAAIDQIQRFCGWRAAAEFCASAAGLLEALNSGRAEAALQ